MIFLSRVTVLNQSIGHIEVVECR